MAIAEYWKDNRLESLKVCYPSEKEKAIWEKAQFVLCLIGYIAASVKLYIVDNKGGKINFISKIIDDKIWIEKGSLANGIYYFWVKNDNHILGKGKFIIHN